MDLNSPLFGKTVFQAKYLPYCENFKLNNDFTCFLAKNYY